MIRESSWVNWVTLSVWEMVEDSREERAESISGSAEEDMSVRRCGGVNCRRICYLISLIVRQLQVFRRANADSILHKIRICINKVKHTNTNQTNFNINNLSRCQYR